MKLSQLNQKSAHLGSKDKPTGGNSGNTNDGGYIWVG